MNRTEELVYLYSKIQENSLLRAQIVGIFVDQNNEYSLSVQFGDFKIILGELDRLDEKFLKLEQTFRKIMNNVGWDTYSTINLKFKDQVVCTKR
jgi:cell division protein FtsQ